MKNKKFTAKVEHSNNFAFCLLNANQIKEARKILEQIKNKHSISPINLAFVHALLGNFPQSNSEYKNLKNKLKSSKDKVGFINLAILHESMSSENRIVENVSPYNICSWNLLLIAAQVRDKNEENEIVINAYKKLAKPKDDNEKQINKRVECWVLYSYQKDTENALSKSRKLLEEVSENSYLYNDVQRDVEIFNEELKKHC
jgi:hypothetical protein